MLPMYQTNPYGVRSELSLSEWERIRQLEQALSASRSELEGLEQLVSASRSYVMNTQNYLNRVVQERAIDDKSIIELTSQTATVAKLHKISLAASVLRLTLSQLEIPASGFTSIPPPLPDLPSGLGIGIRPTKSDITIGSAYSRQGSHNQWTKTDTNIRDLNYPQERTSSYPTHIQDHHRKSASQYSDLNLLSGYTSQAPSNNIPSPIHNSAVLDRQLPSYQAPLPDPPQSTLQPPFQQQVPLQQQPPSYQQPSAYHQPSSYQQPPPLQVPHSNPPT